MTKEMQLIRNCDSLLNDNISQSDEETRQSHQDNIEKQTFNFELITRI